jgi:hypothetical protein
MSTGIGIIVITLVSFPNTYLLFGKNVIGSFRSKFFYWLKSTIFLSIFLLIWSVYKEPEMIIWFHVLISLGAAGLFNLYRANAALMIP